MIKEKPVAFYLKKYGNINLESHRDGLKRSLILNSGLRINSFAIS